MDIPLETQMPTLKQRQDSGRKTDGMQNPGAFSPDDDEAQEADITRASTDGQKSGRRKGGQEQQPRTDVEEEEAEGDEDDADGLGVRPGG
jgi:hypothetical protein